MNYSNPNPFDVSAKTSTGYDGRKFITGFGRETNYLDEAG